MQGGKPALIMAAVNGRFEMCQLLIEKGALINVQDEVSIS
jgi:ankyrin repeat protein